MTRLAEGWFCKDTPYDYEYSPRLEHYFESRSEYSYCGRIGLWDTNRHLAARRRCSLCIMHMLRDGLLRVSAVRRGAW